MTTTTEQISPFLPGFDEEAFNLVASPEATILRAKREEAFAEYSNIPAPTFQTEEYRRTNPRSFGFGKFTRMEKLPVLDQAPVGPWDELFDVVVSISEAGIFIDQKNAAGIRVSTLDQLAERDEATVREYFRGSALTEKDRKFQAMADAFWNIGLAIEVDKNAVIEKGVLIRYAFETENAAVIPRLLIVAGENSQCQIVEHYASANDRAMLAVTSREFYLGRAANVKVVTLQEWGNKTNHIGEDWSQSQADGTINLVSLTLGGKVSKLMVGCDVCERNANAYLGGLYFAIGRQHFDQKTLQRHSSPDTYSNMLYKGAVKGKGHSVYQGFIQATKGSIGVDAYQTNNNLILEEGARADSIPGLIIDADDLACSHGATMGNLDPEQIWYMKARGISEAEARRMLVVGFFEEVVLRVPFEMIRERLHEIIEAKLA